jgi:hypothetical protein
MRAGMCLTLLGLIKVVEGVKHVSSISDELLAVDAFGFLGSSILSYFALKQGDRKKKQRVGKIGDIVFSISLVTLAVICGLLAINLL